MTDEGINKMGFYGDEGINDEGEDSEVGSEIQNMEKKIIEGIKNEA